jgi:hypothetical protein
MTSILSAQFGGMVQHTGGIRSQAGSPVEPLLLLGAGNVKIDLAQGEAPDAAGEQGTQKGLIRKGFGAVRTPLGDAAPGARQRLSPGGTLR